MNALSSEQVATRRIEESVVAPFTLSFNNYNNKQQQQAPSPLLAPVSRPVSRESLALAADYSTSSTSSPTSNPNDDNEDDDHSLFEFLLTDCKEESELLSLPLTSIELPTIELPLTPPPLESASFESCAATLLTPSESESSLSLATAAAIAAQQHVAPPPPPPSLFIKAPPSQLLPVRVGPKPKKRPTSRARSNSKAGNNKKKVIKQQPRTVSLDLPTPVIHKRPFFYNSNMAEQPPFQPQAATAVPTPATITPRPPPATTGSAPQPQAVPHPQAAATAPVGGQPLPSAPTTAVAVRKYVPAPVPAPSQGFPATASYHHAPPQANATRPRSASTASRSSPQADAATSNTVTNIHPTTGQVENTGRWTAEEHRLFLQGLEQHGKGWKKIATLIKSRTVVQIRTHAQKYFQKLAKARQNGDSVGGLGQLVGGMNNGGGNQGGGTVVLHGQTVVQGVTIPMGTAEGDGTIGIPIPCGADGQPVVTMRTTSHPNSTMANGNMAIGSDPTSMAAAAGQVGIATAQGAAGRAGGRKRRNAAPGGGTKRRAIGNVVRSSVREGRNVKRQKIVVETKRKTVPFNQGNRAPLPAPIAAPAPLPQAPLIAVPMQVPSSAAPPGAPPQSKEEYQVPNPLPSVSNVLDPYVNATMGMPPPPKLQNNAPSQQGAKQNGRGRQQMVHTATHGTLPMAALEDAVFRLLTPATGAPSPNMPMPPPMHAPANSNGIVDPLAPQSNQIPIAHTQYHPHPAPVAPPSAPGTISGYPQGIFPNSSPTGVADMSLLPSWVDAKNPPSWYNEGSDIDTLLEDADCLNWLSDTGDLEETYPPAMAEPTAVISSSSTANDVHMPSLEPTPVTNVSSVHDPTAAGGIVYTSTDSLSFLVDPPEQQHHGVLLNAAPLAVETVVAHQPEVAHHVEPTAQVEDVNQLPSFLEDAAHSPEVATTIPSHEALHYASATEAVEATHTTSMNEDPVIPEHKLAGVGESDTNLMGFPDLDMGDEQAFVSALLENSGQSTMSFPKLNSELHMHTTALSSGLLGSVAAEEHHSQVDESA